MKKNYTLWLPAWYPNKNDLYSGDFIQRHAKPVATLLEVIVLHISRDEHSLSLSLNWNFSFTQNLSEYSGFYKSTGGNNIFSKIISFTKYFYFLYSKSNELIKKNGKPCAIHVHVAGRNALVALVISWKHRIPLFYTEHASRFLPEAKKSIHDNLLQKIIWNFFANRCKKISAVSEHLANNIRQLGYAGPIIRIPNVVDPCIFFPKKETTNSLKEKIKILHISNMGYEKNIELVLSVLSAIKKEGVDFELDIYGPATEEKKEQLLFNRELKSSVYFRGEVTHQRIAEVMREADLLIAFSKLETFGCVVAEALVSGLWVIVSDYPSLTELVFNNENGYVIERNDQTGLKNNLIKAMVGIKELKSDPCKNKKLDLMYPESVAQEFMKFYDIIP